MLNNQLPHHIALRAMLIALCLPVVLFMFLAVRTRQLQSTANPRWAQFAKVTGPSASATPIQSASPVQSAVTRLPVLSVSAEVERLAEMEPPLETANKQDSIESNQNGTTIENLKDDLDQVRQELDQLALFQKDHQTEEARIESQLASLMSTIRELVSDIQAKKSIPETPAPAVEVNLEPEASNISEESAKWAQSLTESAQEVDQQHFLTKFGEMTQVKILSGLEAPSKPDQPKQLPRALQSIHLDQSSNEPKYFLFREGNFTLICTVEESANLKPETFNRIHRANLRNDVNETDLSQLLPLIITGLVNVSDQKLRDELSSSSTARSGRFSISRKALASAFYGCAALAVQDGDHKKARQYVNASLRHNKDDIKAIRLKNEINQVSALNQNANH